MKFNFKEGVVVTTDDFWYDLTQGRIKPQKFLDNQAQIDEVKRAIDLLTSLESQMEDSEVLEYS